MKNLFYTLKEVWCRYCRPFAKDIKLISGEGYNDVIPLSSSREVEDIISMLSWWISLDIALRKEALC